MTTPEAISILEEANKWRRGAEMPMPDPKQYGLAIDHAVKELRRSLKKDV